MSSTKEIRTKKISIGKTRQITKAMQMVAASKMRKAEQRMLVSMPYAEKIREVMAHVAASHTEYKHPLLKVHNEFTRVGYIIVSTDRGLCGGLNINLLKKVLEEIQIWSSKEIGIDLCLFGSRAASALKSINVNIDIIAHKDNLGDAPRISDLIGSIKIMLEAYKANKIGKLFLVTNEFVNKMTQRPKITQLLPLELTSSEKRVGYWDYIYETDPKIILDVLLSRYCETEVYQAVVDNLACEQAARMLAMKTATENADEIMNILQLEYNKARQAAITQEISEIIGGAEAV
jgi:F-type H+-transporting ATPase subunit gamma